MQDWFAVAGLIFVGSITPGPNNALALRAGLARDRAAIFAVIMGVQLGALVLLLLCWAGVTALVRSEPLFAPAITILGAAYLVWLGVILMRAKESGPLAPTGKRAILSVLSLQFVNPKAWVMIATVGSVAAGSVHALGLTALFLMLITGACLYGWAAAGAQMARLLSSDTMRRRFDQAMGLLLILSALALIVSQISWSNSHGMV